MVRQQLTEDDLKEVLARAEEIHLRSRERGEIDAVLAAAEEAGLPREAVEQALLERTGGASPNLSPGDLTFAKSSDSRFYVAEVLSVEGPSARVRFLKGAEHTVPLEETRPATFLPGDRVSCNWPVWGWWGCTVVSYNAAKKKVKVSDGWGTDGTFSLSDVRLEPPRAAKRSKGFDRARVYWTLYGLGLVSGGALASWITWLLLR